jgi:membrane protein YdbS with pleckstrin-like domain
MRTKLRPHEKKFFETRSHWITVVKPFLLFLLSVALVVVVFFFVHSPSGFLTIVRWISLILLVTAGLYFLYREWYRRRDIWVITNLRVIDEKGIFTLYTKESPLEKINNVSDYQNILGRMLNYGKIEIQTAAEDGATIYPRVAKPRQLKDAISKCRDEYSEDMHRRKDQAGD